MVPSISGTRSLLDVVPPGIVVAYAGNTIPNNYFLCDGSDKNSDEYPELYAAIGTTFGGSGNFFKVPDLRNEFIRGADSGNRQVGKKENDAFKSHNHNANSDSAGSHSHNTNSTGEHSHSYERWDLDASQSGHGKAWNRDDRVYFRGNEWRDGTGDIFDTTENGSHSHNTNTTGSHTHTINIESTGDNETRPQNVALYYIIKF